MEEDKKSGDDTKRRNNHIDIGDIDGETSTQSHSDSVDDDSFNIDSTDQGSGAGKVQEGLQKIESFELKKVLKGINDAYNALSTPQKLVFTIIASLALGSMTGYRLSSAPISEYKKNISFLDEELSKLNQSLIESENALELCVNKSSELDDEISNLSNNLDASQLDIEILNQEIADLQSYALHISSVNIDAENNLAYVTIVNPTSIPAVINSISFDTDPYKFREEDSIYEIPAIGYIEPRSSRRIIWSEAAADAPEGFIDIHKIYLVKAKTPSNHILEHWYIDIPLIIRVIEWDFRNNKIIIGVATDAIHNIMPINIQEIGLKKISEDNSVYYNVSNPDLIPETHTLGYGDYVWYEAEAGAPQGFLTKNTYYKLRVRYNFILETEHYTCGNTGIFEKTVRHKDDNGSMQEYDS